MILFESLAVAFLLYNIRHYL